MGGKPDPEFFALATAKSPKKAELYERWYMPWVGW